MTKQLSGVVVRDLDQMEKSQRREVARWLRLVAKRIEDRGFEYDKVASFRFIAELRRRAR